MSDSYAEFQNRVSGIYRKETSKPQLRRVSRTIDRDGYIVLRGRRPGINFPWTGLILLAAAFFGVKGATMATLGYDYYASSVGHMTPANLVERAGIWTIEPDPISRWVAVQIKSLR